MKKREKRVLYVLMSVLALTSCSDMKDEPGGEVNVPESNKFAYILNQGNYNTIDGSLNIIDLENSKGVTEAFKIANQRQLGLTPQCGIVYGSKMYLATSGSQTIEIVDKTTIRSEKMISLQNSTVGKSPRSMVAANGKVYISMYEGYVVALDTLTQVITESVKVGPNPEIMCLHKGKLYVPNSEGMNYLTGEPYGKTASIVSLNPLAEEKRFTVPTNPSKFMSNGDDLYLLSVGDYYMESSAVYKINGETSEKVADATVATIEGNRLILGNHVYAEKPEDRILAYTVVDTRTGNKRELNLTESPAPSNLGISPFDGHLIVTTYEQTEGQFADYNSPGWACEYDNNYAFIKKYRIGVGPAAIFFSE